jgi:hypothetical protein
MKLAAYNEIVKVVNRRERWIGFRLNILGLRVWDDGCQLAARNGEQWVTLGPRRSLPVSVPVTATELEEVASDPLRLTAYQYVLEHPGSDLAELLAGQKSFDSGLLDEHAMEVSGQSEWVSVHSGL